MSLLKLSPEATRLRRVAKACAAGELTRSEYREARRQVIDKFVETAQGGNDDTVPRFDLDITQRRFEPTPENVQVVSRQNGLTWMLLCALAVAALTLPLWSWAAVDIGPVNQRDPNPQTSPRYAVEEVYWQVSSALDGKLAEQAQTFLTQALAEIKKADAPQDHGFNETELVEVARFLNAVGVHDTSAQLTRGDLQDLQALIQTQKERRGVSLHQLEQLAAKLQEWLHSRGYPLARAYVPVQSVAAGRVDLAVELGVLSENSVAEQVNVGMQYSMTALINQPVRRDAVETRLNILNRSLGVQAQASFVPGANVGETQMVLHVKEPRRFSGSVELDNYAVEELGEERLRLNGRWLNPRGVGDVLSAMAFTTVDPADHQYGQVAYATPVRHGQYNLDTRLAFADIGLDADVPLNGSGVLFDARLTDTALFTRTLRRELTYRVGVHEFNWDQLEDQRAWFVGAGLEGHRTWDTQQWAVASAIEGLLGGVDHTRPGQDSSFWRLRGQLNAWTPLQLPWLAAHAKLILDLQWQAAADHLPPTLRMSATGPYANKGFSHGDVLLDQGVGVGSALRFDAPVGQWWLFVDATYGEQEGDSDGVNVGWRQLTSAGVGWEGQLLQNPVGRLFSRVTFGYPLSHKGTQGFDDDGTQIYWSLRFEHD